MKIRKNPVMISGLCIALIFGNCLAVSAHTKNEKITVEYAEFDEIQESVPSESGKAAVLTYVEKVGGIYQAIYQDASTMEEDPGATPQTEVSIEKTVVKPYSSFDEMEETLYYEQYVDDFNTWMDGYLSLDKAEKVGSFWYATYSGTLVGSI